MDREIRIIVYDDQGNVVPDGAEILPHYRFELKVTELSEVTDLTKMIEILNYTLKQYIEAGDIAVKMIQFLEKVKDPEFKKLLKNLLFVLRRFEFTDLVELKEDN
jgi:hypothetical protein